MATTIETNETDELIIGELQRGRNLPSNLSAEIDRSRQYVQDRLKRLREHGVVTNVGNGLYELNRDWAAHFFALQDPPADIPLGATVYSTTETGDSGGAVVLGTPDETYGEWCDRHGLDEETRSNADGYAIREAHTGGDKRGVPVVETVPSFHLTPPTKHAEGDLPMLPALLDDGYTVEEAVEYVRERVDGLTAYPESDVYAAKTAEESYSLFRERGYFDGSDGESE